MTSRIRQHVRGVAARWVGERAIPVGGMARDRRLLRQALEGTSVGRVLVVGPGLAVRQALPGAHVDVAGTSRSAEITVCSDVRGENSLPRQRWDTVIVTDPGGDLGERLRAIQHACRRPAHLLVLDRTERATTAGAIMAALAEVASVEDRLVRRGRSVWLSRVRS